MAEHSEALIFLNPQYKSSDFIYGRRMRSAFLIFPVFHGFKEVSDG
jgi:hypothetical protein